jgi:formylglycine-generating enzyme required for sulfatase activity
MGEPKQKSWGNRHALPQHLVKVPSCFLMGETPVTQEQWRTVALYFPKVNRALHPEPSNEAGDRLPVGNISWLDAVEFCDRLSQNSGRNFRLPSEAEWEYACRAGTHTRYYTGETIARSEAEFSSEGTIEVGGFPPNSFGLYDMHGTIGEWCQDRWHNNYEGAPTDGAAWVEGVSDYRVVRGGSPEMHAELCRSACRLKNLEDCEDPLLGFRVACTMI